MAERYGNTVISNRCTVFGIIQLYIYIFIYLFINYDIHQSKCIVQHCDMLRYW